MFLERVVLESPLALLKLFINKLRLITLVLGKFLIGNDGEDRDLSEWFG